MLVQLGFQLRFRMVGYRRAHFVGIGTDIPELNLGQLRSLIRDRFLNDAIGLNKIQGKPFAIAEIVAKIKEILSQ